MALTLPSGNPFAQLETHVEALVPSLVYRLRPLAEGTAAKLIKALKDQSRRADLDEAVQISLAELATRIRVEELPDGFVIGFEDGMSSEDIRFSALARKVEFGDAEIDSTALFGEAGAAMRSAFSSLSRTAFRQAKEKVIG